MDDFDHFDDDETTTTNPNHHTPSNFDDDETTTTNPNRHTPSNFDDDETTTTNPNDHTAGAFQAEVGLRPPPRRAVATVGAAPIAAPARLLRDRVPHVSEPWSPPARLRSPEFEHRPVATPSRYRLVAALGMLLAIAVVALFLLRGTADDGVPDEPVEAALVLAPS